MGWWKTVSRRPFSSFFAIFESGRCLSFCGTFKNHRQTRLRLRSGYPKPEFWVPHPSIPLIITLALTLTWFLQVYIAEVECDVSLAVTRNIHGWTEEALRKLNSKWESTPDHYNKLDLRGFLQDKEITQVEMEDAEPDPQEDLENFDDEDEVRKSSENSTPEGVSHSSSSDDE